MNRNKRKGKRKKVVHNAKLVAVGIGMMMLSSKLQSYAEIPTVAEINQVRAETVEVNLEKATVPVEETVKKEAHNFSFYQVPFGKLPEDIQIYTHEICERYDLPTEIVFAMMQHESRFDNEAVGDDGQSFGYMQVMKKWHKDRMERLGVTDLKDPEGNILVAVDYLSELHQKYGDMASALMAYNCGPTTAEKLWDKEIRKTRYTQKVLQYSKAIHSEIYGGAE